MQCLRYEPKFCSWVIIGYLDIQSKSSGFDGVVDFCLRDLGFDKFGELRAKSSRSGVHSSWTRGPIVP